MTDRDDIDSDFETAAPPEHRLPLSSKWVIAGSLFTTVAVIGLYAWRAGVHEEQVRTLRAQAKSLQLRAPGSVQSYRLKPSVRPPSTPTLRLRQPEPPQLLDLYINVAGSPFHTFQVTVDKQDGARVLLIRRIARDSNGDLRLSWNSSVFAPGEYQFRLEGYDQRGDLRDAGWVSIGIASEVLQR